MSATSSTLPASSVSPPCAAELTGRVCVGTTHHCVALLTAYAAAGCTRIHVWPLGDEVAQLERIARDVLARVAA